MATYAVPPRQGVALLDADPDLAADLDAAESGTARACARVPVETLAVGPWDPGSLGACPAFGLIVLDGLLLREVTVETRVRAEPVGPGDVLRPWDEECLDALPLDYACAWHVVAAARVAVLDDRMSGLLARWPQIGNALLRRTVQRSQRLGLQLAIDQVQGVDVRVRAMLWHLAERWGRVTPAGVVLPYPLTHEMLARLVGARRPSVTTALSALADAGEVQRIREGGWLLSPARVSAR